MKVIIVILLTAFLINTDWVDDVKFQVKLIDETTVLIKGNEVAEDDWITISKTYESNNSRKILVDCKSIADDFFQIKSTAYEKDSVLIALIKVGIWPIMRKGERILNPYIITYESKKYFKNDSVVVELYREVQYSRVNQYKRKKRKLNSKEFETKILDHSDYMEALGYLFEFKE